LTAREVAHCQWSPAFPFPAWVSVVPFEASVTSISCSVSGRPDLCCHRFDLMGFGCWLVFCWGFARCWTVALATGVVSEPGRVSQCRGRCCGWGVIGVGSGVFDPVLWSLGGWSEWGLSSDSGGGFRKEEVTR
jgi:hypothetical protein